MGHFLGEPPVNDGVPTHEAINAFSFFAVSLLKLLNKLSSHRKNWTPEAHLTSL